jgi:hypothetical protein
VQLVKAPLSIEHWKVQGVYASVQVKLKDAEVEPVSSAGCDVIWVDGGVKSIVQV